MATRLLNARRRGAALRSSVGAIGETGGSEVAPTSWRVALPLGVAAGRRIYPTLTDGRMLLLGALRRNAVVERSGSGQVLNTLGTYRTRA